jgi:hypothetical protein
MLTGMQPADRSVGPALKLATDKGDDTMTRKHFTATANILKTTIEDVSLRTALARQFADMFANENGRFDRGRFYTACGL